MKPAARIEQSEVSGSVQESEPCELNAVDWPTGRDLIPLLVTPRQLVESIFRPGVVRMGKLRQEIFHAKKNGLAESGALIRRGRKILIDVVKYFDWMRGGNDGQK